MLESLFPIPDKWLCLSRRNCCIWDCWGYCTVASCFSRCCRALFLFARGLLVYSFSEYSAKRVRWSLLNRSSNATKTGYDGFLRPVSISCTACLLTPTCCATYSSVQWLAIRFCLSTVFTGASFPLMIVRYTRTS